MPTKIAGAFLAVAALTLLLWSGGLALQVRLLDRCNISCNTFADFERADPLCISDPTCVSPLYKPNRATAQNWTGLAYWRSGEQQEHPPVSKTLALPNYTVFILLLLGATIAARCIARASVRRYVLVAIYVWCFLSVTSWFIPSMNPDWPNVSYDMGSPSGWLAIGTLGLSLCLLSGVAITRTRRKHHVEQHGRVPAAP
jgi:hypothetical protein